MKQKKLVKPKGRKFIGITIVVFSVCVVFAVLAMIWEPSPVRESTDDRIEISLEVYVEPNEDGETPVFNINIKNVSAGTMTVLDARRDLALQAAYSPIVLTSMSLWREVRAISGPIVIVQPDDMIALAPGESLQYQSRMEFLNALEYAYQEIEPGIYRAQLSYQPDPDNFTLIYWSQPVEFTLSKKLKPGS